MILEGLAFEHDAEDGAAGGGVGRGDEEDAVEAAGAAEGGIDVPGGVGGGEDQDAFVGGGDAVEFGEELVDEVAAGAGAHVGAGGGEGVDLVEEEDAGAVAAGLLEEFVEVFFGVAEPHVEHVVDADGEEAGVDFAGGGAGEVGFAAAGRAVHEDASAGGFAVGLVEFGVLERVDDFHADFVLEGVHSADVFGRRFWGVRSRRADSPGSSPAAERSLPSKSSSEGRAGVVVGGDAEAGGEGGDRRRRGRSPRPVCTGGRRIRFRRRGGGAWRGGRALWRGAGGL